MKNFKLLLSFVRPFWSWQADNRFNVNVFSRRVTMRLLWKSFLSQHWGKTKNCQDHATYFRLNSVGCNFFAEPEFLTEIWLQIEYNLIGFWQSFDQNKTEFWLNLGYNLKLEYIRYLFISTRKGLHSNFLFQLLNRGQRNVLENLDVTRLQC